MFLIDNFPLLNVDCISYHFLGFVCFFGAPHKQTHISTLNWIFNSFSHSHTHKQFSYYLTYEEYRPMLLRMLYGVSLDHIMLFLHVRFHFYFIMFILCLFSFSSIHSRFLRKHSISTVFVWQTRGMIAKINTHTYTLRKNPPQRKKMCRNVYQDGSFSLEKRNL